MNWRLFFFISAAINVLAIGGLIGFAVGGGFTRDVASIETGPNVAPRAVMRALPPEVRRELRRDLARAWMDSRDERAAWRAANADVTRLLEAEPYDAAAMEAALARQRASSEAVTARFHNAIAQALPRLTPAQRAQTASALASLRTRDAERAAIEPDDMALEAIDPGESAAGEDRAPDGSRREVLREKLRERLRERREQ